MDSAGLLLTCFLLFQMACILIMLNPLYDSRRLTTYIDENIKRYKRVFFISFIGYFINVLYFGIYSPLRKVFDLAFGDSTDQVDQLLALSNVEQNYSTAGFSIFLVVVMLGVKTLLTYTANLTEMAVYSTEQDAKNETKKLCESVDILPNLLRMKRSISYETIFFPNEIRDQLKTVLKNVDGPHCRSAHQTLSKI
ncbi:hypothetical protein NE865_04069 [Phthorimaea operculella]|nr:hypothetical protein NE865_04069 [Phthorimaea operculella]